MSRKTYWPNKDVDPNARSVVDLNEIARNMNSEEAINLIGREDFFEYMIFAPEDEVPDEMIKDIFFTDPISSDLLYVVLSWEIPVSIIDVKTMTDPDTDIQCLHDILEYSSKADVLIATPKSNYVIIASEADYVGQPTIVVHVWDLRRSSIY